MKTVVWFHGSLLTFRAVHHFFGNADQLDQPLSALFVFEQTHKDAFPVPASALRRISSEVSV